MLGGTSLTIGLSRLLDSPIIFFFGFFIFFIVPAFYNKPIKEYFTKCAVFRFGEEGLEIEISDPKKNNLEKTLSYLYREIKSCSLSSDQSQYSALIVLLNNNVTKRFTFVDSYGGDSAKVIYNQIIVNSKKISTNSEIKLAPHFYISKLGTTIITVLGIAIVAFIILQLLFIKKGLPVSIVSTLVLFILIFLRYKRNLPESNNDNKE